MGAALLPCCSTAKLIEHHFKTGSITDAFANSELSLALNLQAEKSSSQKSGWEFLLWFLFLTYYQTSSRPWLQFWWNIWELYQSSSVLVAVMINGILILLAFASGRKWGKPLKCSIGFNTLNICWSFCSSYICSLADFSAIGILNASSLVSPAAVTGHCLWELEAHRNDWARCINIILYLCTIHYIENILHFH